MLAELPAESVQCCVTSPPYMGLRDYHHPQQIGLEPTLQEYVDALVAVFEQVRRVLRADGTLWLALLFLAISGVIGAWRGRRQTIAQSRRQMERHEAFRVARAAGQYVDASRCGHDIDGWKLYSEGLY
ncbi:MAG: hypothetical protein KA756_11745 [Steroidobacteraceae bacterium]|nr:hypothetical protein [Steroidobacteraceae bacterium]